jgi:uncharacterized protein (TIGR02284 family)
MDNDSVIATLNNLIETSKDGEQGFRECAEDIKDPSLQSFFKGRMQECAQAAAELAAEVRRLGGNPSQTGHVAGALHRGWVNVKSLITGKDAKAVIDECERGEDYAVEQYEAALREDLPSDIRALVERQYRGVKKNHDRVRDLQLQYEAKA